LQYKGHESRPAIVDTKNGYFLEASTMAKEFNYEGKKAKRLDEEVERLKEDIGALRRDISALTEALGSVASDYVEEARAKAREKTTEARERVEERVNQVADSGKKAVDDLGDQIGERPITSMLAAAGVGFLVARILDLGRRR